MKTSDLIPQTMAKVNQARANRADVCHRCNDTGGVFYYYATISSPGERHGRLIKGWFHVNCWHKVQQEATQP